MFRAAPLFALIACATPGTPFRADVERVVAASSAKQVAAPDELAPKPWKIGQWATYRDSDGAGYGREAVVAEDACGFWIESLDERYDRRRTVLLCVQSPWALPRETRPPPLDLLQIAIVRWGRGAPSVIDFRGGSNAARKADFAPLVNGLFTPAVDSADNAREDVDVPAGHFAAAVRITTTDARNATVWFHPDVPFDGTVKTRARDGREYVLIAYGEDGATSVLAELAAAAARPPPPSFAPRVFYALAIGLGMLTGASGEASTAGGGFGATFGVHLRRDLDALVDINGFFQESYSPDPSVQQSSATFVLGVRWFPWRGTSESFRPFDRRNVFVQGDVGAAIISRRASTTSDPTTTTGFAAGADVGWFALQRRGYGMAYVLGDRVGFYGSGEGIRHNLAFTVLFELTP